MGLVKVDLGERSYEIVIGPGMIGQLGRLIADALPRARRALIITDTNVAPLYLQAARASLTAAGIAVHDATFPAGESSKTLTQAYSLYPVCLEAGLERSSVIVALGGGVVGDLAGFVAATYLRGIPFVQVPTTLLSQVDSSVGGKTGVDLPEGKNLVGAFHQPSLVVADLDVLKSLPLREICNGMGEVVKHAVIMKADFMDYLEYHADQILALDPEVMGRVVESNCLIKGHVVSADEREGGLRAILNFGHTLGHAVEAQMGYGGWVHGECVAVGMVAATAISKEAGLLRDAKFPARLEKLLTRLGLPTRLPKEITLESLAPLMQRDKKVEGGKIRWVMPVRAGEAFVAPDVPAQAVRRGLEAVKGE